MITIKNVHHVYNELISIPPKDWAYNEIRKLGYLEACLQHFNYLETNIINGKSQINRLYKTNFFQETLDEAIMRMVKNLLKDNNISKDSIINIKNI